MPEALSCSPPLPRPGVKALRKKRARWNMPWAWKIQLYLEDLVISPIIKENKLIWKTLARRKWIA